MSAQEEDEEEKRQRENRRNNNLAAGERQAANVQAQNPMAQGNVAETFDAFGNKVSGTSIRVRAPPGGASSITFWSSIDMFKPSGDCPFENYHSNALLISTQNSSEHSNNLQKN